MKRSFSQARQSRLLRLRHCCPTEADESVFQTNQRQPGSDAARNVFPLMESNNDSDAGAESHTFAGNFGFPECRVLGSKRFFLIFDRTGDGQLNFDGLMAPGS